MAKTSKWVNFLKDCHVKNTAKGVKKQSATQVMEQAAKLWKEMSDAEKDQFATHKGFAKKLAK